MEGHGALGCIQHEQLAPGEAKKGHLVRDLQVREEGDVPGPLHGAEEHPRGQFANVLDAHDVVRLHALTAEARRGVGLCTQQQGNISGQVRVAVEGVPVGQRELPVGRLGGRHPAPLYSCREERGHSTVNDQPWSHMLLYDPNLSQAPEQRQEPGRPAAAGLPATTPYKSPPRPVLTARAQHLPARPIWGWSAENPELVTLPGGSPEL